MPNGPEESLPAFLSADARGVARAAELLKAGEVVALPTETVYGLAANALDENAVRQIFEIKGRPLLDPLIVHGLDVNFFSTLAIFPPTAWRLAEACWPGPLTLVVRKTDRVPRLVTAGRDTVAVRAPAHPVARAILHACQLPLAAPSANPFGYLSPTSAEHVRQSLGAKARWIVDGGPCPVGLESTIVDVSDPATPPRILRPGPITREALEMILGGPVKIAEAKTFRPEPGEGLPAPGMLERHYSPRTGLSLLEPGTQPAMPAPGRRSAWVRLQRPAAGGPLSPPGVEVFWLSEDGNLWHAARELYGLLRKLDEAGYERLWCDVASVTGIGPALNDRLRRASAPSGGPT
jgi:L-threonylcarbamoyladenylate synthase